MIALRDTFAVRFIKAALVSAILMAVLQFVILMSAIWPKVSWYLIGTDVEMSLIELPFMLLLVVVLALGSAWLAFNYASRQHLSGPTYYGAMGLLTAALATTLFTLLVRATLGAQDNGGNYIPFMVSWSRIGWEALPSGVCGGLVFSWSGKSGWNNQSELSRRFE